MKYRLSYHNASPAVNKLVAREIKRQKLFIPKVSPKNLKEMAQVGKTIEQIGLPKNFVCKKLPHNLGYGLFLALKAKPILKGQVIAPYAGEAVIYPENEAEDSNYAFSPLSDMLLTREEQALFDPQNCYRPNRIYSLDIDAHKKGNFTRFINHSAKPNVGAHLLRIPPNSYGVRPTPIEVLYIAKKTIRPGEQLLVSYEGEENSYWAALKIVPFPMTPKTFQINAAGEIFP
jgi:hypothetical protein